MIESTNPEIDVEELMKRVRAEAAKARPREVRQAPPRSPQPATAPVVALPALGDLPTPPPLGSSAPLEVKKDRVDALLQQARSMTEVSSSIPKFLRGLFRRQGGYNKMLLDAVTSLAKTNLQLNKRVQELQAAAQQHHDWIGILVQRRQADADWMKTATPLVGSVAGLPDRIAQAERRIEEAESSATDRIAQTERRIDEVESSATDHIAQTERRIEEVSSAATHALQIEASGRGAAERAHAEQLRDHAQHLQNLQGESNHAGEHLRNLQATADRLLALFDHTERAAEHLRNLQTQVDREIDLVAGLRGDTERHAEHLRNLQDQANTSGEHIRHLQDESERAGEQLRDLRPVRISVARIETEIAQLAGFRSTLARLEERQTSDGLYLKGQLSYHAALLQQAAPSARPSTISTLVAEPQPDGDAAGIDLDQFYVAFENRFRGTRDDIKERVRFYLPFLKKAKAGTATRPVLDLGCGRGEWLELLTDKKLRGRGVDLNTAMVAECVERKLEATHADAIAHLRSVDDNALGCVTGFHIIEHLPFTTLLELFTQVCRVLKPGGLAIFESPNCKNLMVGACYFNVDPTHRNPVFPETAQFIMETQGFEGVQLAYLSPATRPFTAGDHDAEMLNDLLFGPQDFAVIGYKPAAR